MKIKDNFKLGFKMNSYNYNLINNNAFAYIEINLI